MSFVGAALAVGVLEQTDKRCLADEYAGWTTALPFFVAPRHRDNGGVTSPVADWRSPWWPAPSALLNDGGLSDVLDGVWYQDYYPVSGVNGRMLFVGVTRDAYGSALGGCTVRCFATSPTELVSETTSDANGVYSLTTPYGPTVNHFITVHPAGGTLGGASVDTLRPT